MYSPTYFTTDVFTIFLCSINNSSTVSEWARSDRERKGDDAFFHPLFYNFSHYYQIRVTA